MDQYKLKLHPNTIRRLEKFIDQLNSNEKYIDTNNKSYSNYRIFKINTLKRLIYNNSDPKLLNQLKKINLVDKLIDNNDSDSEKESEIEIMNKIDMVV